MRLKEIAACLDGELYGPEDLEISGPAKIESAKPDEITFLSNPKYRHHLSTTKAGAIIVDSSSEKTKIPHIKVKNAYVGFVMLLKLFSPPEHDYFDGISSEAFIDESAKISKGVKLAPLAYIGPNVEIGKDSVIYPGVVLLKDVKIGEQCVLYPNVSIRENCIIGNRVILHNGCVVGSDGFGFAPEGDIYVKIPQIGQVIIEDDVEIGANTTIDRATLGATIIKQGTKLDNLVQIAHNAIIGKNTVLAAQCGIAGSAELGNNVTMGGQSGVVGHVKIADHVMIAGQSGVSKDVNKRVILFGSPALPLTQQKRIEISMRHLPEMVKKIHQLENEIIALKEQLSKGKKRSLNGKKTTDN